MQVSEASSRILAGLLEARTGQQLTSSRKWRIETALAGLMRERGLTSLDQLIASLVAGHGPHLRDQVVDALLNNETSFYRDRAAFDLLLKGALPRLAKARAAEKRLSIWCAGCSTGQEAYSLAMSFAEERLRWSGWHIDILATDVSNEAISRAKEGLYSQFEVQRGLPVLQLMRWFEEKGGQQWHISAELRGAVKFQVHSLVDGPPRVGRFDLILCRNVLLYFAPQTIRSVFAILADASAPDACLMLGAGETAMGHEQFICDPEQRGLYRRAPAERTRALCA